jgi:hypothetical protein
LQSDKGNSPRVAQKHYLQITDEHFQKAVQKAVQQVPAGGGSESQAVTAAQRKTPENPQSQCFPGLPSSGGGIRTPDTRIMIPLL